MRSKLLAICDFNAFTPAAYESFISPCYVMSVVQGKTDLKIRPDCIQALLQLAMPVAGDCRSTTCSQCVHRAPPGGRQIGSRLWHLAQPFCSSGASRKALDHR